MRMLVVFWYFLKEEKKKGEKKQNKQQPPTAPQHRLTKSHTSKDFDCSVQKEKTMWMFCGVNHEARLICQLFQVEARSAAIVSFTKNLGSFPWISHRLWLKGGGFFTVFLILICRVGLLMEFCSCMTLENIFLLKPQKKKVHLRSVFIKIREQFSSIFSSSSSVFSSGSLLSDLKVSQCCQFLNQFLNI